jgi:curli biogenesis system outer membrane secretion channel CsgG
MTKTILAVTTALALTAGIACAQTPGTPGSTKQQPATATQYPPKGTTAQSRTPGTGKNHETGSYAPGGTSSNTPMNDGR